MLKVWVVVACVLVVASATASTALDGSAEQSYTVARSVLNRAAAAATEADAAWTPTDAGTAEAPAAVEFELDATGHPHPVKKDGKHAGKHHAGKHHAHPHPAPPHPTRAERVQSELNGYHKRFEVTPQNTDKLRFAEAADAAESTASESDMLLEAESQAQMHADLAAAMEMKMEAEAEAEAALHAETGVEDALDMEVDAELSLDLAMESAFVETSPAAKSNENYACYRWTRPPKSPLKSAPFAPREGHASWLSKNGKSLYTFGGCDRQTLPKNCYGELKQMDVQTRAWRSRKILGVLDGDKDMSLRMQGAAHAPDTRTGRRLFVFGGLRVDATDNSAFSNSLDLLFYDSLQKEWSFTHVKTTGDHPPPSQDASLVLIGDQLVLFGGYSDNGFFNDVYTIRTSPKNVLVDDKDPELWKWHKVKLDGGAKAVVPPARRGHSMTVQRSGGSYRAFVFGGVSGQSALNDMYVLSVPNWFATPPPPKKGSKAEKDLDGRKHDPVNHWSWVKVVAGSAGRGVAQAIPSARAWHASIVVRPRHLLVFGGCDPFTSKCYDDVLLFNTRTMTWLPTPPSLAQSALAPAVKPKAKKGKDGKPLPVPPPKEPKRRYPAWNPSPRKKLSVTLLRNKSRVLVLGGCDRNECFGDAYEMDLKGVCIDSCGPHGRFVNYRAPIVKKKKGSRRAAAAAKPAAPVTAAAAVAAKSFVELAAEHEVASAEEAYAAQFEADQDEEEDESEADAEAEAEDEDAEEIDEEEAEESLRLEEIELTAEQALAHSAESAAELADDDTIDHPEMDASFLEIGTDAEAAPAAKAAAAKKNAVGANKPPYKMKLIRKKGSKPHKKGGKKGKKAKKPKFVIGGLLSKLSLDMLKELNKERSFDAKCMCRDGYSGKFCQKKSKCHLNCSGHKRGLCVSDKAGSNYCKCSPGFWGIGCQYKACPNHCSSHGLCVPHKTGNGTVSVCKCEAGFWGRDCSLAEEWRREQLEKQNCPMSCSGMGHCTNNYTLSTPVKGKDGKTIPAHPLFHSVNEFNLHPVNRPFDPRAVDVSKIKDPKKRAAIERRQKELRKQNADRIKTQPYKCKCRAGFGGADCSKQCPLLCSRHGRCTSKGQCKCESGWTGAGCDVPTCGKDSLCTGHGTCDKKKGRCKCNGAFRGPACDIDTSCSGHGSWKKGVKGRRGHCKCNPGWMLEDCSLALKCPSDCAKHGRCILKGKKAEKTVRGFTPMSRTFVPSKPNPMAPPPLKREVLGSCVCEKGWQSKDCSQKVCPKGCNRHGECKDGTCACYPGWSGKDCGVQIHCRNNCTDALHGACGLSPLKKDLKTLVPHCKCKAGWTGADCSQLACPKHCSKAGKCLAGKCKCNPGRFGVDCSISCPKGCSGHGECQSTGKCACDAEYTGVDCAKRRSCPSKTNSDCSGHGICHVPSGKCHCEPGFKGADCSEDHSSCANKDCSEHGKCSFGKCFCQIGFSGDNCEIRTVCPKDCSKRGICNNGRCECNPGWAGATCDVQVWDNTCGGGCSNHGLCSKGVCSCIPGWTGADCNKLTDFCKGNDCNGKGTCMYNKCHCLPGTHGDKCEHGNTCPKGCDKDHGVCLMGSCHCLPGFKGESCSEPIICPGVSALGTCSGHGVCLAGACACEPGYGGADCSSLTIAPALVGAACAKNCSGAGVCHLGKCFCVNGFAGHDCSIPYESKCPNDCSGHEPHFDQRGVCHLGKCLCHPGYTGDSCQHEERCPEKCSVNGVCAHGKCFCVAGWTGPACDWKLAGPLKPHSYEEELKEISSRGGCGGCSMHGICIGQKCHCEPGYTGPQCADVAGGVIVHRCPNQCNGQGSCLFGKCFCNPGWTGAGCEKPLELACPNDCGQKGICRFGQCFCYPGFAGKDCSLASKCDATCGVHGVCLDGRCVCADGFTGEQCNIASKRNPNKHRKHAAASFIDTAATVSEESEELVGSSLSEIGAAAAPRSAAMNNAAAHSSSSSSSALLTSASTGAVTVTSYSFPLVPLVLVAFVAGVIVSVFAKCMLDKREAMRRQEQLIKPLLAVPMAHAAPHNPQLAPQQQVNA